MTSPRPHRFVRLLVIGLTISMAPATVAQDNDAADRWTPALSMQYHAIRATAISPDGRHVAYVVRKPIMGDTSSSYLSHIWVVTADGQRNVQFTRGDESATNPSFSPDGQYIAFTSRRSDASRRADESRRSRASRQPRNQLWIIRLLGGEAEQVTDVDPGVGSYEWAPDGRHIAFLMEDPETEEEKQAREEKRDVILVDKNFKYDHLYTVTLQRDAAGKRPVRRLTAGDFHVTGFDWSPDSRTIVLAYQDDPRINTARLSGDLALVPADSGTVTPLVVSDGIHGSPKFSPDGQSVAFRSTGSQPEPIGLDDVYVVPTSGGSPRKLAETHDRSPGLLGWSGDGGSVLFMEAVGTTRQVAALPVDGRPPVMLTSAEGVLGSVSFNDGASMMAFTLQNPNTPVDVHVSPVNQFVPNKITDIHNGVPRPPMGRTELLSWESPDGLPIEGILTYPVDYEPGRRYPLVLNVHGGPAGVYTQTFTGGPSIYMIQYFAQEGFAVLRPNPRGSSGYGKEFRYANFKDWGYGDLSDLLSGVDHVVEMGVAHADSLLLMGWSYGGYMTSFAVTQTDRFKAASMGAGLPNLVSMVTTTDIQDYLVGHMGDEFWNDYETYEKHSAIYQIANVTTPTQVIHGAEDLRVPFTQGQEFYRALGRLGVPTEMIVYPRTPHGPREPKFLMDVSERIMTWFNKHLRPSVPTTDRE